MIYTIIVGGLAGWLASTLMKGKGMGIIMNVLLGILGAFVGAYLLPIIGLKIGGGMIGNIICATCGSVVVLFLAKMFG